MNHTIPFSLPLDRLVHSPEVLCSGLLCIISDWRPGLVWIERVQTEKNRPDYSAHFLIDKAMLAQTRLLDFVNV